MIPRNQYNRKVRVNLECPTCGMNLTDRAVAGFVREGETYCCRGCADGTGCTCVQPTVAQRPKRRISAFEQRETGTARQSGLPSPQLESPSQKKRIVAQRIPSRKASTGIAPKRKRSVTKQRDSSRQQARGRSEFTGSLNKGGATRVSKTGTKSRQAV